MPSFSSLFTSVTGAGFFYQKNPRHATFNFNQDSNALYRNQPRFPFEFYININLNSVGTARSFISGYFNNPTWTQVQPLVKKIDMPSMKIDTTHLNQYNRKRMNQTTMSFEPIRVTFHDVCDGKTLKFWDMYYRYYFGDGNEPGINEAKQVSSKNKPYSVEDFIKNVTPEINPDITSLPASIKKLFQSDSPNDAFSPVNTNGTKSAIENIVTDTLDNHRFGFNLPQVQNIRNLIQSIDIYQVHGGRFNKVTLVNPRISMFQHDTLDYSIGDETLELTMTFEYEYAYYTIQNQLLEEGGTETNTGSLEQFEHGEFLELPALAFNARLVDFMESNNPLLKSDNPILQRIGKNVQSSIGGVTGSFLSDKVVRPLTSSALDGLANIGPKPVHPTGNTSVQTRSFAQSPSLATPSYQDVNRTSGST